MWRSRARGDASKSIHEEKGCHEKRRHYRIVPDDKLRPEYDEALLNNGTRGKYAGQYAASSYIVSLAPDVAAAFPNDEAEKE